MMLYLRSGAFYVGFFLSTIIYALFGIMAYALPFRKRHSIITNWSDVNLWWLALVCKLHYRVEGLENLPDRPSVVMSNHQSTWETLALKKFFPSMSWVVKRELLWIPFFGWGLAATQPIAINRNSTQRAIEQLIRQARQRLENGRWIMIFPEGTRVAPGKKKRYKLGGAIIASKIQVPVIPVAHNAGLFWRRRQFVKHPGTITVSIGPAVEPDGKSPAQINKEVKHWIEARLEKICAPDA